MQPCPFDGWPSQPSPASKLPTTLPGGTPWPLISIITPSYNQGNFISDTILSVFHQDYPNYEHIVIDGASTDQTVDVLRQHNEKLTYWTSAKDRGQSDAINQGMSRAKGQILTWLNSDDMLAPGALAHVAMAFHRSSADLVAGVCQLHRDGTLTQQHLTSCPDGPLSLDDLLDLENCVDRGQFFYQPEVFYTRALWDKAGGKVDDTLNWVMDYDLWIRFAAAKARLKVIGRPVALFRVHEAQKTNSPQAFRGEALRVRDQYRSLYGIPPRAVIPSAARSKKRLRIVLFNDIGFNHGAGIAHRRIAQALSLGGHEVDVIAAARPGSKAVDTEEIPALVNEVIKARAPDAVVLGNLHGAGLGPGILERLSRSFPTLFVTHDLWLITGRCAHMRDCTMFLTGCDASCPTADEPPRVPREDIAAQWRTKMEVLTAKNLLTVAANSQYVHRQIEKLFRQLQSNHPATSRLEQLYLGVSTKTFIPHDKAHARMLLNLPTDKFLVMFIAGDTTNPRKGLDHLFKAVDLLKLPDLRLVCVGWMDSQTSLGRHDMIESGYLPNPRQLALYYSAADLFVGPSLEESFGQVYVEAAACGTPSIGYNVTAVPETVIDHVTGLVAPEVTPRSLAESILRLYHDSTLRSDIGAWARIVADNDFSLGAYYRRLHLILRKMAADTGTILAPKISLQTAPVPRITVTYLQEMRDGQNQFGEDPLAAEYRKHQFYGLELERYRHSPIPWVIRPGAWSARRRRDRAARRMEKLRAIAGSDDAWEDT